MKKLLPLLLLLLVSCTPTNTPPTGSGTSMDSSHLLTEYSDFSLAGKKATLYKSKNCGCCEGYAQALRKQWVDVTVIADNAKLREIRAENKIGEDFQSCHTTFIDGYFVEWHVPINAVKKLLKEKPLVDGITLPGMPIGTPGMDGPKTQIYEIETMTDGKNGVYIEL